MPLPQIPVLKSNLYFLRKWCDLVIEYSQSSQNEVISVRLMQYDQHPKEKNLDTETCIEGRCEEIEGKDSYLE